MTLHWRAPRTESVQCARADLLQSPEPTLQASRPTALPPGGEQVPVKVREDSELAGSCTGGTRT